MLFGPFLALGITLVGAFAAVRAHTVIEETDALRALGTLLTVVMGLLSAVWWHQSADMAAQRVEKDAEEGPQAQEESNLLNAAAAVATALALICGVFSNLAWNTPEGVLAGLTFLLLMSMSGGEIKGAAVLSFNQGLSPRSMVTAFILLLASLLYTIRWLVL